MPSEPAAHRQWNSRVAEWPQRAAVQSAAIIVQGELSVPGGSAASLCAPRLSMTRSPAP